MWLKGCKNDHKEELQVEIDWEDKQWKVKNDTFVFHYCCYVIL